MTTVMYASLVGGAMPLGGWRFATITSGAPSATANGTTAKQWSSADSSTTTTDKVSTTTV